MQYGFKSFIVVAHSMGGLVSRGSEYLRSLYGRDPGVPHYLLFSFQLRAAARNGAARVEGFNELFSRVVR